MDALGLAGVVVVEQQLGLLGQERLAVLVVAVLRAASAADHLLGRNAVDLFGVDAHEVLAAAGDDVGLVAVGAQILQHLVHRLIGQLGVGPVPARILGRREPLLYLGAELVHRHAGERGGENLLKVLHRRASPSPPGCRRARS